MTDAKTPSTLQENIGLAAAVAGSLAPLLGPNAVLAMGVINGLSAAIMQAMGDGTDITDDQIAALLDLDDAAIERDLIVQAAAEARAKG